MDTGAVGSMVVSDVEFQAMLGDFPASDLIEVDRELVAWNVKL